MKTEEEKKIEELKQELVEFNSAKAEMREMKPNVRRCLSNVVTLLKRNKGQYSEGTNLDDLLNLYETLEQETNRAIDGIERDIERFKKQ